MLPVATWYIRRIHRRRFVVQTVFALLWSCWLLLVLVYLNLSFPGLFVDIGFRLSAGGIESENGVNCLIAVCQFLACYFLACGRDTYRCRILDNITLGWF